MLTVTGNLVLRQTVQTCLRSCAYGSGAVQQPETSLSSSKESQRVPPRPKLPAATTPNDLVFDEKTHTGQAWDQEDYRLARFTTASKQVNPNVAMHLIAEVPPAPSTKRVVSCDGGGGALGHPKIYINLDKPGNHACGYCGLRFYLEGQKHDGSEHIQV